MGRVEVGVGLGDSGSVGSGVVGGREAEVERIGHGGWMAVRVLRQEGMDQGGWMSGSCDRSS